MRAIALCLLLCLVACERLPQSARTPLDASVDVEEIDPLDADVSVDASLTDSASEVALPPDAPEDPCDFHARVPLRLRPRTGTARPRVVPTGSALELLRVTYGTRGTLSRLGVFCEVRVRSTGDEGFVYLDAYEVARCQRHRGSSADIAEEHRVLVDGVEEVWRVRFTTPPRLPEPLPEDSTCVERYWERFDVRRAVIERVRDGEVVDRLMNPSSGLDNDDVVPLAEAVLVPGRVGLPVGQRRLTLAESERLPRPTVLSIGDYNHDGQATEFVLDMGPLVCGNDYSGVVGLDQRHRRLHVLEWGAPARTFMVGVNIDWEAVRASASGDVITWSCGNHFYDGEDHLRWAPYNGSLRMSTYTIEYPDRCPWQTRDATDASPD